MNKLLGALVAYFFRWLPHSAPTGLFKIGAPKKDSPVVVTGNFSLTVKRVKKMLEGSNLWLLSANTNGINVWCAAGGGIFTENRVIDAVKISGLAEKVDHRQLILPALCAPGVDCKAIKKQTGFSARLGPVYAKDLPAYLEAGKKKDERMRLFSFGLKHRLDMSLSMNFPIYLPAALALAIFARQYLLGYTIAYWSAVAFIYLFLDIIPGKTGWRQAFFSSVVVLFVWAGLDWYAGAPLRHWGWFIAVFAIFLAIGFDLAGITSARKSDAEQLMYRLGFKKFGSLFQEKPLGKIDLERGRCIGCKSCLDICPVGVYGDPDNNKKITFLNLGACFACGACVKQCPSEALSLV